MRNSLPLLIIFAWLLVLLGALSLGGVYLALPLAAFAAMLAIAWGRSKQSAWNWAAWGSLFWALEETVWTLVRGLDISSLLWASNSFYILGLLFWLIALLRMPRRAFPRISLVATLPILLYLVWLMLQNVGFTRELVFPIVDFSLLLIALPLIEAAFRGQASEGRLLWGLGLLVRALAAALFAWLGPEETNSQLFYLLWVLGYTFIAIGAWLELRNLATGLWATAYTLLSLEIVVGIILAMIYSHPAIHLSTLIATALLLGYMLFASVMLIVAADRNQRRRAEKELQQWANLLERLLGLSPEAGANPRKTLVELFKTLRSFFQDFPAWMSMRKSR